MCLVWKFVCFIIFQIALRWRIEAEVISGKGRRWFVMTPPPIGSVEYCDERVCLFDLHQICCACSYCHGSVLLWRHSDTSCISGFVDDVIFAHKLIRCSTSPPGWGSEAHMYAALNVVRRNVRCRQRTLGTTSCSQGLSCHSRHVEYLWHHACMYCLCMYSDENDVLK